MKCIRYRPILLALLMALLVASLVGCAPAQTGATGDGKVKIGLSFSGWESERWKNEELMLRQLFERKGYEVISESADHDIKLQNEQVDGMVEKGVKALVIIPADADAIVPAVDRAAKAGVLVISYDRLIKSPNIAAYVSFNNTEVGRQQAEGIMKAIKIDQWDLGRKGKVRLVKLGGSKTDNNAILFRKGQDEALAKYADKIEVVADEWVLNWEAETAYQQMKDILAKNSNQIDAVVASNDGTALGALRAMREQNLAGLVPISGQDASAEGCNSIVKGELTLTILKDIRNLAPLAVDLTDKLIKGQSDPNLKKYTLADLTNDPSQSGEVLAYFLPIYQVNSENVFDLVVKSEFQQYDAVYVEIPDSLRPARP